MAVENWAGAPIRLVTDSMSGGGVVHDSFGKLGAAGSMPIDGVPSQAQAEEPLNQVMDPSQYAPGNDRRLIDAGGGLHRPADEPFAQAGSFAQADTEDANAAMWKKTVSSS